MTLYGYEPVFESADAIESRHTRRVPCTSPELSYSGAWTDEANDQYYEGAAERPGKEGARRAKRPTAASSFLSRQRTSIGGRSGGQTAARPTSIWTAAGNERWIAMPKRPRPISSPLSKRVSTRRQRTRSRSSFAARRTPGQRHGRQAYPVRICGGKLPRSDGFSSVPGKNQWYNLQRQGAVDSDMLFKDPKWVGAGKCEVGYYHMTPDAQDAVRKWVAPHAGAVRIEGSVSLDHSGGAAVNVSILHNAAVAAWPARLVTFGNPATHDLTVNVAPGNALYFIVNKKAGTASERTIWDPVVTYLPR